jgi:hypothetical protein
MRVNLVGRRKQFREALGQRLAGLTWQEIGVDVYDRVRMEG